MPRKSRIDAAGALHHIIVRGIDRKEIFKDNKDRSSFLERFGTLLTETKTACLAWALIPNHFHLLLRTGATPISSLMRRLLTGYAVYFNGRHKRCGHLFQNRYKSILCQEDVYLLELVRYIHLNPLRAKLVPDIRKLASYPYSGHSAIMDKKKREWQDTDYVLRMFDEKPSLARRRYNQFVQDGIAMGRRNDLTGGGLIRSQGGWQAVLELRRAKAYQKGDERILGDSGFVEAVLKDAEQSLERKDQYRREGFGFEEALQLVAELYELEAREVITAGKQPLRVQARSLLCFWAVRELGFSVTSVATKLKLTQPAVSRAVSRGERIVQSQGFSLESCRKA